MTALVLLMLAAAPADAGSPTPDAGRPFLVPSLTSLTKPKTGHEGETACASCHGTASWSDVRFNHDRTGFPLTGRHQRAPCKSCHVTDFKTPLTRTCSGCHRDVHAGDLGVRCESCHDTADWRSRFDADAHRRSNFPLFGAHAALPCVECHAEARERRFTRATVDCASCHQNDTARTRGTAVDHDRPDRQWDTRTCSECHGPLRFSPARMPEHDLFPISSGPHAGIGCLACHSSLQVMTAPGRPTGTAACTACHEHQCTTAGGVTETDREHANVTGYQCQDQRCYGCHQPVGARP